MLPGVVRTKYKCNKLHRVQAYIHFLSQTAKLLSSFTAKCIKLFLPYLLIISNYVTFCFASLCQQLSLMRFCFFLGFLSSSILLDKYYHIQKSYYCFQKQILQSTLHMHNTGLPRTERQSQVSSQATNVTALYAAWQNSTRMTVHSTYLSHPQHQTTIAVSWLEEEMNLQVLHAFRMIRSRTREVQFFLSSRFFEANMLCFSWHILEIAI